MLIDPNKPLLWLNVSGPQPRQPGRPGIPQRPKQFSVHHQASVFGPQFSRLASVLERDQSGIELRSDPTSLAPERMLVFEVRGSVPSFVNAVRRVPGLEFIDEGELEGDAQDQDPTVYLLVPDAQALSNIASLWFRWTQGEDLGIGFAPWRDLFATLRNIRPWGPQDRLQAEERNIIAEEIALMADAERMRLEIELVYRASEVHADESETDLTKAIIGAGGHVVSRCRIADIGYHAILVELNVAAVRSVIEMARESIAGLDPVMYIRPQSTATTIEVGEAEDTAPEEPLVVHRSPKNYFKFKPTTVVCSQLF